jgi:hypothetical protein
MNKVNHKVVKPYRLKEHSVNVRAVRTESSSFYSERCSPAAAAALGPVALITLFITGVLLLHALK